MNKMYPGVYYVQKLHRSEFYSFNYWTIKHLHSKKNLVCIFYIPDEETHDVVTRVLDKSIQECGQINHSAFVTLHNYFFPNSQIATK